MPSLLPSLKLRAREHELEILRRAAAANDMSWNQWALAVLLDAATRRHVVEKPAPTTSRRHVEEAIRLLRRALDAE